MRNPVTSTAVPDRGEGKRGTEGHLGYLLRQAHVAFRARLEHALAGLGVTQPQFTVLTMVAAYPGASGADLARLSLLTPQTVSVIVGNLKRADLLQDAPHPVHGRIRCLTLTAKADEVLAACKAKVAALEAALVDGLPPADEAAVRRWLVAVAQRAPAGGRAPE